MKQIINISLLVFLLSIPFALSQTRKAIPAGRYESLSGVKVSHGAKNLDNSQVNDSLGLFWIEVAKHFQIERGDNFYFKTGDIDANFRTLLASKGVIEAKKFDNRINIFLSDDINRDSHLIKKLKIKGSLLIFKDKQALKEVMVNLEKFEVIIYQKETDFNYYLLKLK